MKAQQKTVVCGRPGRSVRVAGLGVIIYRHGWLVNIGQGTTPKSDRQEAQAFGTLIKEMMGGCSPLQGATTVMQQAMIADGTLACTSKQVWWGENKDVERHGATCRKAKSCTQMKMARARTYLDDVALELCVFDRVLESHQIGS